MVAQALASSGTPGARILSINVGSSSIKFGVYDVALDQVCFESVIDRPTSVGDALNGIQEMLEQAGANRFDAIGHRIAHGGDAYSEAVVIDAGVETAIERCVPLAPQHNPVNLAGVRMARERWPHLPQVAVFDTAFHRTIPAHAGTYAVPLAWREAGLRRYGFHGTSHQQVMEVVADYLGTPPGELRIVSCHLGNGASLCAIDRGRSIDTSMGMTALEGLVMGSRCGDLDPGAHAYLMQTLGLSAAQIHSDLYGNSGLLALAGSADLREVEAKASLGDSSAELALQVFAYRVRKYIGAYAAAMDGWDVVAFTGGIGENSPAMRRRICKGLGFLGLRLSDERNDAARPDSPEPLQLQQPDSPVKALVIRAREEWMIARETYRVLAQGISPTALSRVARAQVTCPLPAVPV